MPPCHTPILPTCCAEALEHYNWAIEQLDQQVVDDEITPEGKELLANCHANIAAIKLRQEKWEEAARRFWVLHRRYGQGGDKPWRRIRNDDDHRDDDKDEDDNKTKNRGLTMLYGTTNT